MTQHVLLPRRRLFHWSVGAFLAAGVPLAGQARARRRIEVWKDPACGCCIDWIGHVEAHGLTVRVHDAGRVQARERLGLPAQYASCHTAQLDGYAIEGHVGMPEIERLLRERPDALGLAVPGMPIGSPGMDGAAYGGRRDAYDTLLVLRDGSRRVFARHG